MLKTRFKKFKTLDFPQIYLFLAVKNVKFSTLLTEFLTFLLKTPVNYSLYTDFCIYTVFAYIS